VKILFCSFLLLIPTASFAQLTYEQRAAFAKDPIWIDRVGVAAQQQSVIAQGENPELCCQTSAQEALAPGASNLCSLVIPPGTPTAADHIKLHSIDRHAARAQLAMNVTRNPGDMAWRMAAAIASDSCVAPPFTDAQLQAYMTRAWDLWSLPPELAAPPVVQVNPTALAPAPQPGLLTPNAPPRVVPRFP
jgi:hypothetical protein